MRLYLAGAGVDGRCHILDGLDNLALLVSYWHILNSKGWAVVNWANEQGVPVFLDSGAFSAFNSGAQINLSDYIAFCKEHKDKFDAIASLDVIADWKASEINYNKMRQAGIDYSIHTFHIKEPFSFLEELITENDYIALGVAGTQTRWEYKRHLWRWLIKCFQIIQEVNPVCRVHGFGLTSDKIMYSFPFYSVDSTTWLVARMFGEAIVKDGRRLVRVGRDKPKNYKKYYRLVNHLLPREKSQPTGHNDRLLRYNARTMLEWVNELSTK